MMPDYPRRQLDHYSLSCASDRPALMVHYLQEGEQETYERREPDAVRAELCDTFDRMTRGEFAADPAKQRCGLCPVRLACSDRASG